MTAGLQLPGMEGLQEFGSNFMRLQQLFSQRESEALAPANAPANAPADVKSVEQAGSTPTLKKDKAATKPTVETPKGLHPQCSISTSSTIGTTMRFAGWPRRS
jgi:hypothetical protein